MALDSVIKTLLQSGFAECTVFWGVRIMLKFPENQGVPFTCPYLVCGDSSSVIFQTVFYSVPWLMTCLATVCAAVGRAQLHICLRAGGPGTCTN